jgi:AbrB family looped-hinge helix DNA binding protein
VRQALNLTWYRAGRRNPHSFSPWPEKSEKYRKKGLLQKSRKYHIMASNNKKEDKMPISVLTSKGQMTIPKEVRRALNLQPSEKVIIVVEGNQAIIQPLKGNLLDIGGSVKITDREKPINFKKVRGKVKKRVAKKAVTRGRIHGE